MGGEQQIKSNRGASSAADSAVLRRPPHDAAEVAAAWKVDPRTVTRWARAGKLSSIRALGGHRRYREAEVIALKNIPGDPA